MEPSDVLYQLSSYLQTNNKYISELAKTFLQDENLSIQQYIDSMMGPNNWKPDELMLVIMAPMFKVKFCIACKNGRIWFSTKGRSLMDCDIYMGKLGFKKYALYAHANFEFKINGRQLKSNSYLLRQSKDEENIITSDGATSQDFNSQGEWNTIPSLDTVTVESSQCAVGQSQIATSEPSSDKTQHIDVCDRTVQETNVIGASSAIPNSDNLSSESVNRIEIVEEISRPPSESTNCDTEQLTNNDNMDIAFRSGDDMSTIGASDQEQELLKTYSIAH